MDVLNSLGSFRLTCPIDSRQTASPIGVSKWGMPVFLSGHSTLPIMNIPLSKDLEELIRRKVESREYLSAGHVIEEALSLLEERDQVADLRRARLIRRLAFAVSQANSRQLVSMSEVFAGLARKSNALE